MGLDTKFITKNTSICFIKTRDSVNVQLVGSYYGKITESTTLGPA